MRILLFLATNIAILAVISIVMKVLGLEGYLDQQGVNLNLQGLLAISAVIGMTGSLISLITSKWSAKRMMGVQVIESPRDNNESWLLDTVARQAKEAGIGMPEVGIYNGPELNAFATGMNRNKALVAVSTGLLQNMDSDEVEAVLAHEISHVANGDMLTLALIQGVVNTFVYFLSRVVGHVIDRAVFKTQRGYGPAYFMIVMAAQMLLGFLASIIVMWFSRRREFRADAGGAKLAGREKMIAALQRLQGDSPPLPDQLAAFGIAGGRGWAKLFMTHPPLADRIQTLRADGPPN